MSCPEHCKSVLRTFIADGFGVDVTVSTAPPLIHGRFPPARHTCPHGKVLYAEPTGEQIAAWNTGRSS